MMMAVVAERLPPVKLAFRWPRRCSRRRVQQRALAASAPRGSASGSAGQQQPGQRIYHGNGDHDPLRFGGVVPD